MVYSVLDSYFPLAVHHDRGEVINRKLSNNKRWES